MPAGGIAYVVEPAPAEDELVRRIIASYRGADAEAMRKVLLDNPWAEVTTSNRSFQGRVDSLNTLRRERSRKVQQAMQESVNAYRATLVLADRLPVGGASAVGEHGRAVGSRVVIQGAGTTGTWGESQREQAARDLSRLKAQPRTSVAGVGSARTTDIFVAR
jgi:hypothetical protein